jgi:hypothetical protein
MRLRISSALRPLIRCRYSSVMHSPVGPFGKPYRLQNHSKILQAAPTQIESLTLRGYSPRLSLTAISISWSEPRYRSVVWIEEWPSRNLICSRSPPFFLHSFAQVRRRS